MDSKENKPRKKIRTHRIRPKRIDLTAPVWPHEHRKWETATKRRRIKHFRSLPKKIREELNIVCNYIKQRDANASLKLTGSWIKGTWADENTKPVFRALRMKIKRKPGVSDLDLVLKTELSFTREELQALITTRIHLWTLNFDRVEGLVLFDTRQNIKRR